MKRLWTALLRTFSFQGCFVNAASKVKQIQLSAALRYAVGRFAQVTITFIMSALPFNFSHTLSVITLIVHKLSKYETLPQAANPD